MVEPAISEQSWTNATVWCQQFRIRRWQFCHLHQESRTTLTCYGRCAKRIRWCRVQRPAPLKLHDAKESASFHFREMSPYGWRQCTVVQHDRLPESIDHGGPLNNNTSLVRSDAKGTSIHFAIRTFYLRYFVPLCCHQWLHMNLWTTTRPHSIFQMPKTIFLGVDCVRFDFLLLISFITLYSAGAVFVDLHFFT